MGRLVVLARLAGMRPGLELSGQLPLSDKTPRMKVDGHKGFTTG